MLITAEKIFGGFKFSSTLLNDIVQLFVQKGTTVWEKSYRTQKSQIVSLCVYHFWVYFFYNIDADFSIQHQHYKRALIFFLKVLSLLN